MVNTLTRLGLVVLVNQLGGRADPNMIQNGFLLVMNEPGSGRDVRRTLAKTRIISNYSENHLKSDQYRDATRLRTLELISWILDSGDHTRLGLTREDVVTPLRKVFKMGMIRWRSQPTRSRVQQPIRDQVPFFENRTKTEDSESYV